MFQINNILICWQLSIKTAEYKINFGITVSYSNVFDVIVGSLPPPAKNIAVFIAFQGKRELEPCKKVDTVQQVCLA